MMCVSPKTNLLEFDIELPSRDTLIDAGSMKNEFEKLLNSSVTKCEIIRAKYKVNSSLRVLYCITTNEAEKLISARVYAKNPENIEFYHFPNDRKIKNLDVLQRKFDCRIVAYAPEKCATAECVDANGQVFGYAKIYAEKEWATGKKVCRFLIEQTQRNFPKLLAFDEENRILVLEAVTGQQLSALDGTQITHGFYLLGKAIGEFHNLPTAIELPEFSRLSPDKINFAGKIISLTRPDCAAQAEFLAENLLKSFHFADEERVLLHGDVHPKNGILRDAETVSLIDFDQLSTGSAAAEIGSFLAGLFYKEIIGLNSKNERRTYSASFLEGYSKIRNLPTRESLNWHIATALLTERALRSISRIRAEGLQSFSQILATSEQVLEGGKI